MRRVAQTFGHLGQGGGGVDSRAAVGEPESAGVASCFVQLAGKGEGGGAADGDEVGFLAAAGFDGEEDTAGCFEEGFYYGRVRIGWPGEMGRGLFLL